MMHDKVSHRTSTGPVRNLQVRHTTSIRCVQWVRGCYSTQSIYRSVTAQIKQGKPEPDHEEINKWVNKYMCKEVARHQVHAREVF
jgi:hypothetical protein